VLKLDAVSKTYNHHARMVTALDSATLEIEQGEYVAVVGPSGSGKSTLLLVLGGMLSPSEGTVLFDGKSLYDLTPDQRAGIRQKNIGFVFQTFNLVPYLTAIENVQVPLLLAGVAEAEQGERAAALLERVGLGDRLDHKPRELSVGQQQRVALARVLANDPAVILADEPTGNLDTTTGANIMHLLQELSGQGKTILMVTHEEDIAAYGDHRLYLRDGRIDRIEGGE
jgi:putative ABC transport system ATP-binding protein